MVCVFGIVVQPPPYEFFTEDLYRVSRICKGGIAKYYWWKCDSEGCREEQQRDHNGKDPLKCKSSDATLMYGKS